MEPIAEDEPATQEDSHDEPATQEDVRAYEDEGAEQVGGNAAPHSACDNGGSTEDGCDSGGDVPSSSSDARASSLKRPRPPQPAASAACATGGGPMMARRAEVAWATKLSRTISIDRLPQESKRMGMGRIHRMPSEEGIGRKTISMLLRPRTWSPAADGSFVLDSNEVIWLCDQVQELLEAESTLLQLSAPVKVFGDIHGQYTDLMRLFDQFGAPSRESGDINLVDYLFLGDYVDRGKHSLEVICLLLALKLQFPSRVFLVRGNHESPEVNARDGFLHECVKRLGGRGPGVVAWRRLNLLFEWLPMGALVNGCILTVHGGIGRYIESPSQIATLERPLRMGGEHAELLLDLLWSDPTASDDVLGVHTNEERGAPVVCFGPDRVHSFLRDNGLSLIIRAHECVMDGFQRFAGGKLITVFSATNYCNRWANAGAILLIGKDLEIVPKMIYPLDDLEDAWINAPGDDGTSGGSDTHEDLQDMRPPTPPRDAGGENESPRASSHQLAKSMAPPPPRRSLLGAGGHPNGGEGGGSSESGESGSTSTKSTGNGIDMRRDREASNSSSAGCAGAPRAP